MRQRSDGSAAWRATDVPPRKSEGIHRNHELVTRGLPGRRSASRSASRVHSSPLSFDVPRDGRASVDEQYDSTGEDSKVLMLTRKNIQLIEENIKFNSKCSMQSDGNEHLDRQLDSLGYSEISNPLFEASSKQEEGSAQPMKYKDIEGRDGTGSIMGKEKALSPVIGGGVLVGLERDAAHDTTTQLLTSVEDSSVFSKAGSIKFSQKNVLTDHGSKNDSSSESGYAPGANKSSTVQGAGSSSQHVANEEADDDLREQVRHLQSHLKDQLGVNKQLSSYLQESKDVVQTLQQRLRLFKQRPAEVRLRACEQRLRGVQQRADKLDEELEEVKADNLRLKEQVAKERRLREKAQENLRRTRQAVEMSGTACDLEVACKARDEWAATCAASGGVAPQ